MVLSSIEYEIKQKVENAGRPLKDWDIQMYRGVLTGYNDAFIINKGTRDMLVASSPKSDEIIRPILRGRDVQRYYANWQDLYIIGTFPSLKIDINKYPSIKDYLLIHDYNRLKQTGEKGSRKKTNNKWFETQDSISYWEDFFRPKIIYPEITKFINFYLDNTQNYYVNNKCFILTGKHLEFLVAFLNSSLFKYCFINNFPELLGGTRELRKIFMEKIPVVQISDEQNALFAQKIYKIQEQKNIGNETIVLEKEIDELVFDLYKLTKDERESIGFIEIS